MWEIPLQGCILSSGGDDLRWEFINESQSIIA